MENLPDGTVVGRVVGLWRYPVKSMGAEALTQVDVTWHGVAGDRRWAFVRDDVPDSGFPWLTLRERGDMSHYLPSFTHPDRPDRSRLSVRTPAGALLDVTDPALARELYPSGARSIKNDRGVYDTFPLSLITTQTIGQLGHMVGEPLTVQRFRPNILVEAADRSPFTEDQWVGKTLRVGALRMRMDQRDGRCVVITIDPETTRRNPDVLSVVTRERQGCLGIYGTTVEPGRIALNDAVVVETANA